MAFDDVPRRTALKAGVAVGGLGIIGGVAVSTRNGRVLGSQRDDRDLPGARDLTTITVPGELDRLVQLLPNDETNDRAVGRGTTALLESSVLDGVPDAIVRGFDPKADRGMDLEAVGKVTFIGWGAGPDEIGAIIWADWDEEQLLAELAGTDDPDATERTDADRRVYTVGDVTAAAITDVVFAVGTDGVVEAVIDVWHGSGDALSGEIPSAFGLTAVASPARFVVQDPQPVCEGVDVASASEPENQTVHLFGELGADGDDRVATLNLVGGSREEMRAMETELSDALFDGPPDEGSSPTIPPEIASDVDVVRENYVTTVGYRAPADEFEDGIDAFLETAGCYVGL